MERLGDDPTHALNPVKIVLRLLTMDMTARIAEAQVIPLIGC
jgi:hypothetical protein